MADTKESLHPDPEQESKLETAYELIEAAEGELKRLLAINTAVRMDNERVGDERTTTEALALYLRKHYMDEIEAGRHVGMTLAEVVIMYLQKERNRWGRLPGRLLASFLRTGKGD